MGFFHHYTDAITTLGHKCWSLSTWGFRLFDWIFIVAWQRLLPTHLQLGSPRYYSSSTLLISRRYTLGHWVIIPILRIELPSSLYWQPLLLKPLRT